MEIKELLRKEKEIWMGDKLSLSQIIVCMGKVFGDICRWERNEAKDANIHTEEELKKELGNMIASTTRWCDDLGYDPEDCVNLAMKAQEKFVKENKK